MTNPNALHIDEYDAAEAIVGYIASGPSAHDNQTRDASFLKWHWLRFGSHLERRRLNSDKSSTSPKVNKEANRLRTRLEFADRGLRALQRSLDVPRVDVPGRPCQKTDVIEERKALEFLSTEKFHLTSSSAKVETGRIGRFFKSFVEKDPAWHGRLHFAPACCATSTPRLMISERELWTVISAQPNPEVKSRNQAALLMFAKLVPRYVEAVR